MVIINVLYYHPLRSAGLIKQRFGVLELYKWFATKTRLGHWKSNMMVRVLLGFFFRTCVFPKRLANELAQIVIIPQSLDLIDCTMVLSISACKFDAKHILDAFKHVPDLF